MMVLRLCGLFFDIERITQFENKSNVTYITVAEMDNLLLVDKIYKENNKSAVKHAAAVLTARFVFCL